jgi:hypothetical protein
MAGTQDQAAREIVEVLRAVGVSLRMDDGDLLIGGTTKAMQVWTSMSAAIPNLDALVITALTETLDRDSAADTLEQHRRAGEGAGALMETLSGGLPPAVPVSGVGVKLEPAAPSLPTLPPPPHYNGVPVIDAEGFRWKARRDLARARGERFHEPPPYRWPFGSV